MTAARLFVSDLSWSPHRNTKALLQKVNFRLDGGQTMGIVGPNGAGKTSLLRMLYRFHKPTSGQILIDDENLWQMSARAAAQRIAVVLQEQPNDFALTTGEIVALGRTPHRQGFAASRGANDKKIVDTALANLQLHGFANRRLGTLSGGERQRVMVARALAQEPRILILDEPTNHLDIRHQLEILELIRGLPITIVTSLHDLNLAADVCDQILLLEKGHPVGVGAPKDVLTENAVSDTFGVRAQRERLQPSAQEHLTFHLHQKGSHR